MLILINLSSLFISDQSGSNVINFIDILKEPVLVSLIIFIVFLFTISFLLIGSPFSSFLNQKLKLLV